MRTCICHLLTTFKKRPVSYSISTMGTSISSAEILRKRNTFISFSSISNLSTSLEKEEEKFKIYTLPSYKIFSKRKSSIDPFKNTSTGSKGNNLYH